MPTNMIFSGSSSRTDAKCTFSIAGNGNKATFRYEKRDGSCNLQGTIEVSSAARIKRTDAFKRAQTMSVKTLVNNWKIYTSERDIIVFSDNADYGFIVNNRDPLVINVSDCLDCLSEISDLGLLEYFKEKAFCDFLTRQNTTLKDLVLLPGMNKQKLMLVADSSQYALPKLIKAGLSLANLCSLPLDKLKYLLENTNAIDALMRKGVTVEILLQADTDQLKFVLENSYRLDRLIAKGATLKLILQTDKNVLNHLLGDSYKIDKALKLITLEQMTGHSHQSRAVDNVAEVMIDDSFKHYLSYGSGSIEGKDFCWSHDSKPGEVVITCTDKKENRSSKFNLVLGQAKEEYRASFLDQSSVKPKIRLIHDWYVLKDDPTQKTVYSPNNAMLVTTQWDATFPCNKFVTEGISDAYLYASAYHQELSFAKWLEQRNFSMDKLRDLPDMTHNLLLLIFKGRDAIKAIYERGMKLEALFNINNKRLRHILTHSDALESALCFVSLEEVLGLNQHVQAEAIMRGNSPIFKPIGVKSQEDSERQSVSQCIVM